jgi:uncharacterized membrane protein YvbJ
MNLKEICKMKYCSHCGKELLDEAVVCHSCGCPVDNRPQQPMPQTQSYSILSIVGLVFAFIGPLIGLIVSIIANSNAKACGDVKSMSLSKTGIILSAVFLVIYVLLIILFTAVLLSAGYYSVTV